MELLEREGPLQALAWALREATGGRGSVVLVSGEPGIGKTALLTEFRRRLAEGVRASWGACDHLSVPRPFGPVRDLTGFGRLHDALDADEPAHHIHSLVLEELSHGSGPRVLVLEDVHWADEATVDLVTVVGRRIKGLPALLVLSYRRGELDAGHPLVAALDAIRSAVSLQLQLAPLSRAAVGELAGGETERVYAATGGNPFYVTEMIAALPHRELPVSVASAVQGRVAQLDKRSRDLVELVSMVPTKISISVLDATMPDWPGAAEEPERRDLLTVDAAQVAFRHELARTAIMTGVPAARRRVLHTAVLDALLATGADPADIAHHAEAAGNTDVMAQHALVAARRAAAVESNREAFAHYRRAAAGADRLEPSARADLYEQLAVAAYTVDKLAEARAAAELAIELNQHLDRAEAAGRCTRILARCHWYAGEGQASWETAISAVQILQPLGDSVELARAFSTVSQLAMLAGRSEEALSWGGRSVDLAERLGAHGVKAHALVNIGSVRMEVDPHDTAALLEGFRLADQGGDRHEAVRALLNLAFCALAWVQPARAWEYTRSAIAYAEEHQVDALLLYLRAMSAWLRLREGDWEAAEATARAVADTGTSVAQLLARTVLAELSVRRGDDDAAELLADLAEQAQLTGELQRIAPVLQLQTERALVAALDPPRAEFERDALLLHSASGWGAAGVAAWAAVAGVPVTWEGRAFGPYAAMIRCDWAGAAAGFGDVGWDYDRALMLSLLDDEAALGEALLLTRRLGAGPLERRVRRRMRHLALPVPQGPRRATLTNPGRLTSRQTEVLELLREGLTNAEIAARLTISVRTVEHHVEAILAKLGVASRRDAAVR